MGHTHIPGGDAQVGERVRGGAALQHHGGDDDERGGGEHGLARLRHRVADGQRERHRAAESCQREPI